MPAPAVVRAGGRTQAPPTLAVCGKTAIQATSLREESALAILCLIIAAGGLLLGTCCRFPALMAATAMVIATTVVVGWVIGLSLGTVALDAILFAAVLHVAYLTGLVALARRRAARPKPSTDSVRAAPERMP
jgi:hypothetical protein